jgi:hypothetical protein
MNTTNTTPEPEITPYRRMILKNLVYYHNRYDNDVEFRQREIDRNRRRVTSQYANDPVFRQKMIDNARARYQRIKAAKQAAAAQ